MKDCGSFRKNFVKVTIPLFYVMYSRLSFICNPVGVFFNL